MTHTDIKQVFKRLGISQRGAAQFLKMPEQYLSEYLNGKRELESQQQIRLENYVDKLTELIQ